MLKGGGGVVGFFHLTTAARDLHPAERVGGGEGWRGLRERGVGKRDE